MQIGNVMAVTGKWVKSTYEWLNKHQEGCGSICYDADDRYRYCVCIGWHNLGDGPKEKDYHHWEIAWKIGRQTRNNVMQCDLDIDFEMPYNEDGDVEDTEEVIKTVWRQASHRMPVGYRNWDALASHMRAEARRVFRLYRE